MNKGKTTVLLINLGTPDTPKVSDVRRYLGEFLNDPRVIDISAIARALLVNLIIVPFRAPKSAKVYQELWTENGSPLMYYGEQLQQKLQAQLPDEYVVELAMRYQNPSLDSVLARIQKSQPSKLIIIPLFPHYASSSSGSAIQKAMEIIAKWWVIPEIHIVNQYFLNPGYINTIVERAKKYNISDYDYVLFSYHGVPVRQLDKNYPDDLCDDHNCEHDLDAENQYCYKAECYATSRELVKRLNIPEDKHQTVFQSRLGRDPWVEPYADKVIENLAKEGKKKLLVFSPAFVADCLETTIEIGEEYLELFQEHGGEQLDLVESLNDHPLWVETLKQMVLQKSAL